MGFFSWKTSDTNESISNQFSSKGCSTVYMLSPDGNHIEEEEYEGYGVFGGIDAFVHWMEWNEPEKCKGKSDTEIRDLFFSDDQYNKTNGGKENCKYPLKFASKPVDYDSVPASERCENQGHFY